MRVTRNKHHNHFHFDYSLQNVQSIKYIGITITDNTKKQDQVQIQRGGQGVWTPPGKSQVIWVSIGNKQLDPPPPLENVEMLDPSGTLKNDIFY